MIKVLVKKLNPDVELPTYKTSGASGMDLMAFINKPIKLAPNSSCLVSTGLSVAFSEDYELQIRPRSGLAAKDQITILNTPGTVDSDYRGEIKIILFNHGSKEFIVNNKDIKLYSLPKMDPKKTLELGIKGATKNVDKAIIEIKSNLSKLNIDWRDNN